MSLVDVWQALADAGAAGLPDVNCTAYEPADPTVPALFPVLPDNGTYTNTLYPPTVDFTVTLRLLVVALGGSDVATGNLLPYADPTGPQSVRAAIAADPTLGGLVDDATVTGWSAAGEIVYPSATYLGVDFTVALMVTA